jgi:hypothetical protein
MPMKRRRRNAGEWNLSEHPHLLTNGIKRIRGCVPLMEGACLVCSP